MASAERNSLRAWATLEPTVLDRALAGASRRGELDRLLEDAGHDDAGGPLLTWPRALLAVAAVALLSFGGFYLATTPDPLVADLATVRVAQRAGATVPASLVDAVRERLGDKAAAELLLRDPFAATAFDEAASGSGQLRGPGTAPLTLETPRATVSSSQPRFVVSFDLPGDTRWQIEVLLRHADTGREHEFTLGPTDRPPGKVRFGTPGTDLEPGLWRVEVRLAAEHELEVEPTFGEFEVATPEALAAVQSAANMTGDEHTDALVLAAAQLSRGLAQDALQSLGTRSSDDPAVLLLEARAHTLLGNRDSVELLRDRWRDLVAQQKR